MRHVQVLLKKPCNGDTQAQVQQRQLHRQAPSTPVIVKLSVERGVRARVGAL